MNIAKALKDARDAKWMTQEELAMRTILTLNKIQGIEEGLIEYDHISKQEMHSIAEAMDIPLEAFLILGLEDQDIVPGKKETAAILLPPIQKLIKELIKDKEEE